MFFFVRFESWLSGLTFCEPKLKTRVWRNETNFLAICDLYFSIILATFDKGIFSERFLRSFKTNPDCGDLVKNLEKWRVLWWWKMACNLKCWILGNPKSFFTIKKNKKVWEALNVTFSNKLWFEQKLYYCRPGKPKWVTSSWHNNCWLRDLSAVNWKKKATGFKSLRVNGWEIKGTVMQIMQ